MPAFSISGHGSSAHHFHELAPGPMNFTPASQKLYKARIFRKESITGVYRLSARLLCDI
jgi:hypothetical protein